MISTNLLELPEEANQEATDQQETTNCTTQKPLLHGNLQKWAYTTEPCPPNYPIPLATHSTKKQAFEEAPVVQVTFQAKVTSLGLESSS